MITAIILTLILVAIAWTAFQFFNEWLLRRRCPPGSRLPPMPTTTSIRGHVELLARDFHRKKCLEWAREHGPVIRLKLNFINVVILNDFESIKLFCNTKELLWRSSCFIRYRDSCKGLGVMNGETWSANRKFCMSLLRGSGFARSAMENDMQEEFLRFTENVRKTNGRPYDVGSYVIPCAFNNVVHFFYGAQLPHDHPTLHEFHQLLKQLGRALLSGPQNQFLPWMVRRLLAWLPFTRNHRIASAVAKMDAINSKQIEKYKAWVSGDESKDFILGYTKKIEDSKYEPTPFFTDRYLVGNLNSFLLGGTFTTARLMMWHLLNFAKHPDTVQVKVQREIDNVVGHNRQPTWEDRKRMPYTLACVWEMQRWKTIVPLGVSRECADDVVVGDFFIPKGTVVIPNVWAVHNDPALWQEPEKFKPERYFRKDGILLPRKPEHLIPFGVGRRSCPAEGVVTMEIFLMITFLLQKYRIVPEQPIDHNFETPDFEMSPFKSTRLCFLPRFVEEF